MLNLAFEIVHQTSPLCLWTFQEEAGALRISLGQYSYALHEMAGKVERVEDGVLGPYAALLKEGQWFKLPRAECPALNLHGPSARLSMVAWIKRRPKSNDQCQAVAGMWHETGKKRQYCLFLNLAIWNSHEQVAGHVSATGGPTPGHSWCMEAAIGSTPVTYETWQMVAFTFDGEFVRVYLNGQLDHRNELNPYYWPHALFDGGVEGSDFTVGAVHRLEEMGNWYSGYLGGLAVYDYALSEATLLKLAHDTMPD